MLYSSAAASMVHGGGGSGSVLCAPGPLDSRMVGGSVLLPLLQGSSIGGGLGDKRDCEEWDFVLHPAGDTSQSPAGDEGGDSLDGGAAGTRTPPPFIPDLSCLFEFEFEFGFKLILYLVPLPKVTR